MYLISYFLLPPDDVSHLKRLQLDRECLECSLSWVFVFVIYDVTHIFIILCVLHKEFDHYHTMNFFSF